MFHKLLNCREKANEKHPDFQMFYSDFVYVCQQIRKEWGTIVPLIWNNELYLRQTPKTLTKKQNKKNCKNTSGFFLYRLPNTNN